MLSTSETKILIELSAGGEEYAYNFKYLAQRTGLSVDLVKAVCHGLKAQGLAKSMRALMDENTCQVAGSGYSITPEGKAAIGNGWRVEVWDSVYDEWKPACSPYDNYDDAHSVMKHYEEARKYLPHRVSQV